MSADLVDASTAENLEARRRHAAERVRAPWRFCAARIVSCAPVRLRFPVPHPSARHGWSPCSRAAVCCLFCVRGPAACPTRSSFLWTQEVAWRGSRTPSQHFGAVLAALPPRPRPRLPPPPFSTRPPSTRCVCTHTRARLAMCRVLFTLRCAVRGARCALLVGRLAGSSITPESIMGVYEASFERGWEAKDLLDPDNSLALAALPAAHATAGAGEGSDVRDDDGPE
jgi:hypothetical protein